MANSDLRSTRTLTVTSVNYTVNGSKTSITGNGTSIVVLGGGFNSVIHTVERDHKFFVGVGGAMCCLFDYGFTRLLLLLVNSFVFGSPVLVTIRLLLVGLLASYTPTVSFDVRGTRGSIVGHGNFSNINEVLGVGSFAGITIRNLFVTVVSLLSCVVNRFISPSVNAAVTFLDLNLTRLLRYCGSGLRKDVFGGGLFSGHFVGCSMFAATFVVVFLMFAPINFVFNLAVLGF